MDEQSYKVNWPRIWSSSRRSLMNQCPRAWALKYGFIRNRNGVFNRHLHHISDWSPPWRLMQRALRGLIIERLQYFSRGEKWPAKELALRLRHRIIGGLAVQKNTVDIVETRLRDSSKLNRKIPEQEIDRLVEIACNRFHTAIESKPIASILNGSIKEWFTCSRLDKTKVDSWQLHIAPDLVWKQGRTWHLLRFTVQGGEIVTPFKILEHMTMAIWAIERPGLPMVAERFTVETLTWSRGFWHHWVERADSRIVEIAIQMIKSDIRAMVDLYKRMGPLCDLSQLPLATNRRTCRNCGHIDTCPGGEDLLRARLEQSALELTKATTKIGKSRQSNQPQK
tara:strand:- start:114 stop:1127 length:1014 start_codon:yes stop_codon:yes gene_type:complete